MLKRKLRVYIASSFNQIDKVKMVSSFLENCGFKITGKWWDRVYHVGSDIKSTKELKKEYDNLNWFVFRNKKQSIESFYSDFKGIVDSDILVFVASDDKKKYNGASVEYGIAVGLNKRCYLLGELENSVMFNKLIKVDTIHELIDELLIIDSIE